MTISLSLVALVAAWVLLLLGVDPVPTWFYVFAWYPTLMLLDGVASRMDGRPSLLLQRPSLAFSLFAWSPVVWLVFEAINFRLTNWYYVFLPAHTAERWAGILLSFATVLPAIVLAERALDAARVFARGRGPRVSVRQWHLRASVGLALVSAALVIVWPRLFFPLVWGVGLLLAEPLVYRRAPQLSLFADLARGYWGRIGRLLLGGLGIGFLWELYNHFGEGSWIYTVPGLEQLKLFEMPPFGFVGFPVFALEAWAMYAALAALGVAVPVVGERAIARGRSAITAVVAIAFAALTLNGMEDYTISSTAPRLGDLPGIEPGEVMSLRQAGVTRVRQLADADDGWTERLPSLGPAQAHAALESAKLVSLRGMGAAHARTLGALGITRVCDLIGRDATDLAATMRTLGPAHRPLPAEVRVWMRAAERDCAIEKRR